MALASVDSAKRRMIEYNHDAAGRPRRILPTYSMKTGSWGISDIYRQRVETGEATIECVEGVTGNAPKPYCGNRHSLRTAYNRHCFGHRFPYIQ